MPHEYDPRHFSERYFIYHTTIMGNGYGNWGINFDDIKYNGESLPHVKAAEITIDFGFILSTDTYKYYFDKKFFLESNITDFCKEEQVNIYIFKYCEEKVIKEFENISFVLSKQYNTYNESNILEFDYKDLFIKSPNDSNLYYFQIVFQENNYKWKLGRPVFKKYPAVFDQEKRIFGFYTQTGEYEIPDDGKNDKNGGNKNGGLTFSWIMVIILSSFLILLIIAFFIVCRKIKRKKRANEMDDDYEYSSKKIIEN